MPAGAQGRSKKRRARTTVPIHIVTNSKGESLVLPPIALVFKSITDKIEWFNHTERDVLLILPDGVFDQPSIEPSIPPHAKLPKRLRDDAPLGAHAYQVFSFATRTLAKGQSDPEMIIVP